MTERYLDPVYGKKSELEMPNIYEKHYELDEIERYEDFDEEDSFDFYYQ